MAKREVWEDRGMERATEAGRGAGFSGVRPGPWAWARASQCPQGVWLNPGLIQLIPSTTRSQQPPGKRATPGPGAALSGLGSRELLVLFRARPLSCSALSRSSCEPSVP